MKRVQKLFWGTWWICEYTWTWQKCICESVPCENQPTLTNANDTWHASKGVKKEMKKIAYGHKKLKGIAWHPRLHQSIPILTTPWRNAKDPQKNWENYYTTLWSITRISMRAVQQSQGVKLIPIMSLQNK